MQRDVEEYPVAVGVVLDLILEDNVVWLFEGENSCSGGEMTGLYSTDDMNQHVPDRYERRGVLPELVVGW